ncbi:uncharacterized protein LOC108938328 isoform X1 [Scleropages formosus]|uniref:uncharacterized protein LOC108938328 isoform X1 n=2 Tax=Scleropages formosus TaxID=113540 RepID=UPI0010FA76CB|nr:uncharacterized protein LOC108938328 isoform X1 [Scleropages formosus]
MGGSVLLLLGLVCVNVLADSSDIEVEKNVWAVLGEDVVLRCQYIGQSAILYSSWSMEQTNGKWKQLVVYFMQQVTINDNRFGIPISSSNLTVTMNVSSKEDEQEYKCSFFTGSETTEGKVTLRIMAPPSVHTQVQEAVENGLHYQTVICSATGGRPKAELFWLVHGQQASGQAFSINTTSLEGPNGTFTQTSVLQFATHVMNEGYVTCAVNHRALATPTHVRVEVKHFVAPILTMETNLVQEKMEDFHEVTCRAEGGRPAPSLTWSLPENTFREWNISDKMQQDRRAYNDTETLSSTLRFPVHLHEGWNVTCIINHPKFLYEQRRTSSLPTYRFFSMQVFSPGGSSAGQILLEEGNSNVSIQLEVAGNVPHYQVTCTKEDGSLPKDMTVTGSSLWIGGPVELAHAGQYECQASYYQHKVSVQLEIQVIPEELPQVVVPPIIMTHTWVNSDLRAFQCSATGAIPAASVSWLFPEDLSRTILSNDTFQNETHCVSRILLRPICLSRELLVECVIQHPALSSAAIQQITLPACFGPDVSLHSTTAWEDGIQYTLVECRAESAKPAPAIEWTIKNDHGSNNTIQLSEVTTTNWTSENGSITVHSVARLPSHSFYRRIVTCVVTHEALEKEIMKEICIPAVEPPVPVVSIRNQQVSSWWLAVCEITWHMEFNLSWVLPEKNTGRTQPCLRTDGVRYWANSTYEFPLDLHEGQNLTCRIQTEHISIDKTVHIPRYNISLALANATLVLRRNLVQRVTLQAHVRNQKVQLRVHGKMPRFNFTCFRSDGSPAITEGVALVFPFLVSEQDAGLYTCHASFYHHHTTLLLQVEVADKDEELWNIVLICFSMAVAIVLILIVCLCIFCKKHRRESSASVVSSNKRESLAALTSLMADHRSPELKKSAVPTPLIQKDQQYPELVRYSIVIDIKSTV